MINPVVFRTSAEGSRCKARHTAKPRTHVRAARSATSSEIREIASVSILSRKLPSRCSKRWCCQTGDLRGRLWIATCRECQVAEHLKPHRQLAGQRLGHGPRADTALPQDVVRQTGDQD